MTSQHTFFCSEPLVLGGGHGNAIDRSQVGGKAAELTRLVQFGFEVPSFFCITTRAFDLFLNAAKLKPLADRCLQKIHPDDYRSIEKRAKRLQEAILSAPIPIEVQEAVAEAYRKWGKQRRVCVRSSAVAEDLGAASFAGQYDTILNVWGEESLFAALGNCWASAFDPAAMQYRVKQGIDDQGFAVIVQQMIDAVGAGVAFTVNPVTGSNREVVINASFGLGEAIVSGRVAPDQYIVAKGADGRVKADISEKTEKWIPSKKSPGSLQKVRLAVDDRNRAVLTEKEVFELAHLALAVEKKYGTARDIEWAIADGRIHLLQSRPVTALPVMGPPEGWLPELNTPIPERYPLYSNGNISEVLPGTITPLTWSLTGPALEYAFRKPLLEMRLLDEEKDLKEPWVIMGFFYHRPYLNISFFRELADKTPAMTRDAVDEEFMGHKPVNRSTLPFNFRKPDQWRKLFQMFRVIRRKPEEIREHIRGTEYRIAAEKAKLKKGAAGTATFEQLLEAVRPGQEGYDLLATHIWASEFAVVNFDMLRRFTFRFLADLDGMLASRLVTGLAEVESAKPSLELWRLSRSVAASRGLKKMFKHFNNRDLYYELSRAKKGSAGKQFFQGLEIFLDNYGHRGVLEAELMNPTWKEGPSYVLGIIRNYAGANPEKDPGSIVERQRIERRRAEDEAQSRLGFYLRPLFLRLLQSAQTYIKCREKVKALVIEDGGHARPYLEPLKRKMVRRGYIKTGEDIYFLTSPELEQIGKGEMQPADALETVQRRRRDFQWCRQVRMPSLIEGQAVPLEEVEAPVADSQLRGLGVSPGRVTGQARVILDPREDMHIAQGEILVAPVTDVGWAPLFLSASALVVDIGGMLSHGSIVAREYGLPAVVNVKTGTRVIQTGDRITVDGNSGLVILHSA